MSGSEDPVEAGEDGESSNSSPSSPTPSSVKKQPIIAQTTAESKIPRPSSLPSPTPLRRSGSLRVRGEKPLFGLSRAPVRGTPTSGNYHFPSITETESWKSARARIKAGGDALSAPRHQFRHFQSSSLTSTPISGPSSLPHTLTPSPDDADHLRSGNLNRFLLDHTKDLGSDREDLDSLRSFGSNLSTQSACDHAHFARNGTTFSGRKMRYIVHCSSANSESVEYLTPTQRANRQIRRLKAMVEQSKKDLESKDEAIFRLTKEVVELRLLREEGDAGPVSASTPQIRPHCNGEEKMANTSDELEVPASLSDSGHFDELLSTTSAHSSHSPGHRLNIACGDTERETYQRKIDEITRKQYEKNQEDRKSLIEMYERKMEDMTKKLTEKYNEEKRLLTESHERRIDNMLTSQMSEKTALNKKHEEIISDLNKLNEESINELKNEHENISKIAKQLEEVNTNNSSLQMELFQTRERAIQLEEELEMLKESMKTQEQKFTQCQENNVMSAQLEAEVQFLRRSMEDQEELSRNFSAAIEEKEKLKIKLQEKIAMCAQLEEKLQELQESMENQEELTKNFNSSIAEKEELKLQLENKSAKCDQLAAEVELLQQSMEKQKELSRILDVAVEEKRQLELNLEGESAKCAQLEVEVQSLQESFDKQTELSRNFDAFMEETQQVKLKLEDKSAKCAQLEAELQLLQHSVEEQKELGRNFDALVEETQQLKLKLEDKSAKCDQLEGELQLLQQSVEEQKTLGRNFDALVEETQQLKLKLEDKSAKCDQLEGELQLLQHTVEEQKELLRNFDALIEETQQLKLKLGDKCAKYDQLEAEVQLLQQFLEEKEQLELKLEDKSAVCAQLEGEVQCLNNAVQEKEQLQDHLNNSLREKRYIQEQLNEKSVFFSELQSEVALLRESFTEQEQIRINLEKQSVARIQDLENQLREHKEKANYYCDLESELNTLKKQLANCEHIRDELLAEKEHYEKEIQVLQKVDDQQSAKSVAFNARENLMQLKEHIQILKKENENSLQLQEKLKLREISEKEELRNTACSLQVLLEKLNESLVNQEQINQPTENYSAELKGEIKEVLEKTLFENEDLSQKLALTNQRLSVLSKENEELKNNVASFENKFKSETENYNTLKRSIEENNTKKKESEKRYVAQLKAEITELNDTIAQEKKICEELKEDRDTSVKLRTEVQFLTNIISERDQKYDELLKSAEKMKTEMSNALNEKNKKLEEFASNTVKLENEIKSLKNSMAEQEAKHNDINLKMYQKGQEAAKFERKDEVLELAARAPEKVSVPELITQLSETEKELERVKDEQVKSVQQNNPYLLSSKEAICLYLVGTFQALYRRLAESQANSSSSPEATLLFLKSAFYYFLTDEANCQGHLHAIQSILGFTEAEKHAIESLTYFRR